MIVGLLAALGAAACYEIGYVLQTLEARTIEPSGSVRPSVLGHLARRRRWLAGTLLAAAGAVLQVWALSLAPLSLVQPALALGLLGLLAMARVMLGERVGRRERWAALAIVVGVAIITSAAPKRGDSVAAGIAVPVAMSLLGALAVSPYLARSRPAGHPRWALIGAAAGDAWVVLALKLLSDELSRDRWVAALAWGAGAGAIGALALAAEMTALQRLRATSVAPVVLMSQVAVPVALAPLVANEMWGPTPGGGSVLISGLLLVIVGAAVLGASRPVGDIRAAARGLPDPPADPPGDPPAG